MKKLLAIVAIAGSGTSGFAQVSPTRYAGLELARLTQEYKDDRGTVPDVSGTIKAVSPILKGGLHFLDWLDGELHFRLPQRARYTDSRGNEVYLQTGVVGVFAKPNTNLDSVNVYGLLGYAAVLTNSEAVASGDLSPAVGVGAQYLLTKEISISGGYTQYARNVELGNRQRTKINSVGVGMNYTFGK